MLKSSRRRLLGAGIAAVLSPLLLLPALAQNNQPYILFAGQDATRAHTERAITFLDQYNANYRVLDVAQFEQVMAVNFTAPMLLIHHLLPALTAAPGSHLVNVSSLYGIIAPPGQSAYSSSKFALRGLSEVLRGELLESGVGVTTVHPGGVRTRIAETARIAADAPAEEVAAGQRMFAALLTYPPEKAAAEILDGVRRRRGRVLIASSAKVPDLLARLMPVSHLKVLDRITRAVARGGQARSRVDG